MLYQPVSQWHSLHFELLIELVAQKLTELWRFKNLAYFLTWTKFGDDMSKRSWVMLDKTDRLTDRQTNRQTNILAKNCKFWQVITSHRRCSVSFWDNFMNETSFFPSHQVISRYVFRLGLSWKLRNFKNGCHFGASANFLAGSGTGIWRYNQDSHGQALCSAFMIGFLAQILTKLRWLKNLTHF